MKKTPRELLLARHQAATSKLDTIRRRVADGLNQNTRREAANRGDAAGLTSLLETLWAEVFLPTRRAWLGLAAVWVAIGLIRVAAPTTAPLVTDRTPVPVLQMLMASDNSETAEPANGKQLPREKKAQPRPRREGRAANVQRFASRNAERALTGF